MRIIYKGNYIKMMCGEIGLVDVTSRSSSFEYTISVHAVHAGAERNVCNIVVFILKHPQTSTNPSQTLLPVNRLAHVTTTARAKAILRLKTLAFIPS